jgi:exodeoxyribonuclease V beta subunit
MKPGPKSFDLVDTPIKPGLTLLEASAGTGKTFALAGLYLRCVVELGFSVDAILAVTFTKAATAELKERIRSRLRSALRAIQTPGGPPPDDPLVSALWDKTGPAMADRLRAATALYDEAQIFTIHGFCQRTLTHLAFETGMAFDAEVLADDSELLRRLADDFWRRTFYRADRAVVVAALCENLTPVKLSEMVHHFSAHPELLVLPETDATDSGAAIASMREALGRAESAIREDAEALLASLTDKKIFKQSKSEGIPADRVTSLVDQVRCGDPSVESFRFLKLLAPDTLRSMLKKNAPFPDHPAFERCAEFAVALERMAGAMVGDFARDVRDGLPKRCRESGLLTHDMTIQLLADAIDSPSGKRVVEALSKRYQAGLIDEFQDTDPAQAKIFRAIFKGANRHLFFIGDPKQSIYQFRNADVRTYLGAAREADRRYTLATCYRSEPRFVEALNALYAKVADPFRVEGIRYIQVGVPASRPKPVALLEGVGEPIRFRHLPAPDATKEQATPEMVRALVNDVASLLHRATLGGQPLRPDQIAVLVRKNAQAETVVDALRAAGISAIRKSGDSVFQTREAQDLLRVIRAMLDPASERTVKTALWGDLLRLDDEKLANLDGSGEWNAIVEDFRRDRETWERRGFLPMFRSLLARGDRRKRLLKQPGGERMLTNFLHLAELLQREAEEGHLGSVALADRFSRRMLEGRSSGEAAELRLESDGNAVQVATTHKTKGLEYPVVLCPFLWDHPGKNDIVPYHLDDNRLAYDPLGRSDQSATRIAAERAEESARLFYVAVTRAKNACWIYTADLKKENAGGGLFAVLAGDGPLSLRARTVAEAHPDLIGYSEIDPGAAPAPENAAVARTPSIRLGERPITAPIPSARLTASFSSIIARHESPDASPALDDAPAPIEGDGAGEGLFGFERGPRAGIFFHALLEHFAFDRTDDPLPFVTDRLARHGYGSEFARPVAAMLERLAAMPLFPEARLRETATSDRLPEIEFLFPVKDLTSARLNRVLRDRGATHFPDAVAAAFDSLDFAPVSGFVQGVIDLLLRCGERYYVIDWKSNWLGNRATDYGPDGLLAGMIAHHYHLQSLIYVAAADRFLASRLPGYAYGRHFGGTAYLFLRGLGDGTGTTGVYRDRPSLDLVRAIQAI